MSSLRGVDGKALRVLTDVLVIGPEVVADALKAWRL
jgi:hypothetical protein